MFAQPDDLTDDDVAAALRGGWGLVPEELGYAALGFGSHHWNPFQRDARWFVTVDDLDARGGFANQPRDVRRRVKQHLRMALDTAAELHHGGRTYVTAPLPSLAGAVIEDLGERYVVALYPHIDGRAGSWGRYESATDRSAVVDRLVDLHTAALPEPSPADVDDFLIPGRDELAAVIDETSAPWSTGPFAEPARSLLARHAAELVAVLHRYDALVTSSVRSASATSSPTASRTPAMSSSRPTAQRSSTGTPPSSPHPSVICGA